MRIERKVTYYGYDLVINHVLHKRCLNCREWYQFDGEKGFCERCINDSHAPKHKNEEQ